MKGLLAIGLAVAMASGLHAQDGLRSASLPERPIATQPPGPEDLFRAGPNTYRPRPDRDHLWHGRPPGLSNGSSYWPYLNVPAPEPPQVIEPRSEARFVKRATVPPAPEPPSALAPYVPQPAPVVVKTMYVIPRCYAGDQPPDVSIKCDLTKLRTIR